MLLAAVCRLADWMLFWFQTFIWRQMQSWAPEFMAGLAKPWLRYKLQEQNPIEQNAILKLFVKNKARKLWLSGNVIAAEFCTLTLFETCSTQVAAVTAGSLFFCQTGIRPHSSAKPSWKRPWFLYRPLRAPRWSQATLFANGKKCYLILRLKSQSIIRISVDISSPYYIFCRFLFDIFILSHSCLAVG